MQRAKEIENAFSGDDLPILREISAPRGKAALLYHPDLTDPELCFRIIGWTEKISDKRLSLDEIRKNYDLSILMTTHDFSLLPRYADQVVLIDHGVLIQGDPQTVLDSEEFHRTFHMRGGRA